MAALTPEKLIQVFYTCGLSAIPIVRDDTIRTYLAHEKVESRVHTDAFFRDDIIAMLPQLTQRLEDQVFFTEVDRLAPAQVPVVDAQTFGLELLELSAFNTRFRPLTELAPGDYQSLLEDAACPILLFNTRHDLIFRNKYHRKLLTLFQNHLGGRRPKVEEYLPPPFFKTLDRHDTEKTYELSTSDGSRLVRYRLSRLTLQGGDVILVTFLLS